MQTPLYIMYVYVYICAYFVVYSKWYILILSNSMYLYFHLTVSMKKYNQNYKQSMLAELVCQHNFPKIEAI